MKPAYLRSYYYGYLTCLKSLISTTVTSGTLFVDEPRVLGDPEAATRMRGSPSVDLKFRPNWGSGKKLVATITGTTSVRHLPNRSIVWRRNCCHVARSGAAQWMGRLASAQRQQQSHSDHPQHVRRIISHLTMASQLTPLQIDIPGKIRRFPREPHHPPTLPPHLRGPGQTPRRVLLAPARRARLRTQR